MLLHNQKNASIEWSGEGRTFRWGPYGSCDVPDHLFPHIRGQGFPVDVTPVPPRRKTEEATEVERSERERSELFQLRKQLEEAQAESRAARGATEAAEARETAAIERATDAERCVAVLEQQLKNAQSEAVEYEKLLSDAKAQGQAAEPAAKPAKNPPKEK